MEQLIRDLLFADDAALVTHSERPAARNISLYGRGCLALWFGSQPEKDCGPPPNCT